ncbi:MAG: ATPase, T2SS/T4P/T4SS family [Actinomycetota bacterium]
MRKHKRLGEVLVEAGAIDQATLDAALEHQRATKNRMGKHVRLGSLLVDMAAISEEDIAHVVSVQIGIPFIDLNSASVDPDLINIVPRRLADRYGLIPVERLGDGIRVAMVDPTDVVAIDDLRVVAKVGTIHTAVATASGIRDAIDRFYTLESQASNVVSRLGVAADVEVVNDPTTSTQADNVFEGDGKEAPIVRLANGVLADAVRSRATDVHIEPHDHDVKVRYRIDGLLREVMTLPKSVLGPLVSRLKIMNGCDISERRRPQDGRGKILVEKREVSTRLSVIPTMQGEKVVIRLLRQGEETIDLGETGLNEDGLRVLRDIIGLPQGFVLFTGPTGSGKTTTMYAALQAILRPEVNICTLEDPIEYQFSGINQVQIDDRTGVTFARGLRSMLRQDPNVIMVGEIRDVETAQISLQAAMTGHLVLSTVHTNDAPSAVTRLVDMGVEPFLVASALSAVIAQRLVRVICAHCKEPTEPSADVLDRLGLTTEVLRDAKLYRGIGCESCGFSGYRGRIGIFEVLPITRQIRDQISAQASGSAIASAARAMGIETLLEAGLTKVRSGITTLEEVLRAVQVLHEPDRPQCPSCRHEIDESFVVCPYCQFELGALKCRACGREVRREWTVCPYCRADLPVAPKTNGGKKRLMIADDDPSLRQLTHVMFEEDYDVLEAAGGEEALRKAALERPDVILLDLHMPDMSGIEVAKRLRSTAATSMIPLVMLTGDDTGEIESLRAGVDDYITKPFDEDRLRARLERVLRPH